MQNYLLFIDTETSGLPKNWNLPYSDNTNWPYAVQISWVIYTADQIEVKREDHYIKDADFVISPSAFKIHGITRDYLSKNGKSRIDVMNLLANDLNQYQPLVVGHFMELDFNITGVDFYRVGMENPMRNLPMFCTMLATTHMVRNPQNKFLKLGQLYQLLFDRSLQVQHNAMTDAMATAESFFELLQNCAIDETKIANQQIERERNQKPVLKGGCAMPFIVLLLFTLLIAYWI